MGQDFLDIQYEEKPNKKTLVFNATGNVDKLTDPVKSKNYIII